MSTFISPVDAALQQAEYERNADAAFWGPLNDFRGALLSLVANQSSLSYPLSFSAKIVEFWQEGRSSRTHSQQIYLVNAIITLIESHDQQLLRLERHTAAQQNSVDRLSAMVDSVLSSAQGSSSKEKLDMLALIAVNGAFLYQGDPLEQPQEFIRMASQLTNTDVFVLRQLAQSQMETRASLSKLDDNVNPLQADRSDFLRHLESHVRPVFYRSAFVRLQALGLVERMTPGFGSPDPPYEVLELGSLFLGYLTVHRSSSLNEQQQEAVSNDGR